MKEKEFAAMHNLACADSSKDSHKPIPYSGSMNICGHTHGAHEIRLSSKYNFLVQVVT